MSMEHVTIFHSNDIHADYLPGVDKEGRAVGGIAYLAGYIKEQRMKKPDSTLYVFAGDMFKGHLLDLETRGQDSIRFMNIICPDVATLGNHELDYQLSCLDYYKERCSFPLINTNMIDTFAEDYFFEPYTIKRVGGIKILFMGVITKEIKARKSKDFLMKMNVEWKDPKTQIEELLKQLKEDQVSYDMAVVLSHLGYEEDCELAESFSDDVKIDMIIGGHSHTLPDDVIERNGVRIVQAGSGTTQIGHLEIDFDMETKKICDCTWSADMILDEEIVPNQEIADRVDAFKDQVQEKYYTVLAHLQDDKGMIRDADNHTRYAGTEVGNLVCDALREHYDLDVVMIGSGSLRQTKMRKEITKAEILEMYPYNDENLYMIFLKGKELKTAAETFLRNCPLNEGMDGKDYHVEFFQISHGFYFEFSTQKNGLVKATYNDHDIDDEEIFRTGIEGYHLNMAKEHLGLENIQEILARKHENRYKRKKAYSIKNSLKEYVREHGLISFCTEVRVKKV